MLSLNNLRIIESRKMISEVSVRIWKAAVMFHHKYPCIHLERLRKTTKYLVRIVCKSTKSQTGYLLNVSQQCCCSVH